MSPRSPFETNINSPQEEGDQGVPERTHAEKEQAEEKADQAFQAEMAATRKDQVKAGLQEVAQQKEELEKNRFLQAVLKEETTFMTSYGQMEIPDLTAKIIQETVKLIQEGAAGLQEIDLTAEDAADRVGEWAGLVEEQRIRLNAINEELVKVKKLIEDFRNKRYEEIKSVEQSAEELSEEMLSVLKKDAMQSVLKDRDKWVGLLDANEVQYFFSKGMDFREFRKNRKEENAKIEQALEGAKHGKEAVDQKELLLTTKGALSKELIEEKRKDVEEVKSKLPNFEERVAAQKKKELDPLVEPTLKEIQKFWRQNKKLIEDCMIKVTTKEKGITKLEGNIGRAGNKADQWRSRDSYKSKANIEEAKKDFAKLKEAVEKVTGAESKEKDRSEDQAKAEKAKRKNQEARAELDKLLDEIWDNVKQANKDEGPYANRNFIVKAWAKRKGQKDFSVKSAKNGLRAIRKAIKDRGFLHKDKRSVRNQIKDHEGVIKRYYATR